MITAFAVAYGLSQLFFGPVGDRFGKYIVIAWACLACAVSALLCGFAPTFSWLLVARALAGATAAAIIPLSTAWIGDVVPYSRAATGARALSHGADSWRLRWRARRRTGGRLPELARAVFRDRGDFRRDRRAAVSPRSSPARLCAHHAQGDRRRRAANDRGIRPGSGRNRGREWCWQRYSSRARCCSARSPSSRRTCIACTACRYPSRVRWSCCSASADCCTRLRPGALVHRLRRGRVDSMGWRIAGGVAAR